jgi:pimeloyl-ACP methyl ester carboxylesterase
MDDRHTDEIQDRYNDIRCPVTILWGEQDSWIPVARGRTLASRISGADFQIVPEASHLVPEDAPEAIVATVLDFVARVA